MAGDARLDSLRPFGRRVVGRSQIANGLEPWPVPRSGSHRLVDETLDYVDEHDATPRPRDVVADDEGVIAVGDKIDDVVDLGVGIDVVAEIGATVKVGDPLLRVYYRESRRLEVATLLLTAATPCLEAPES